MGQFSMLLFADCKIRKQESAKYFLCNTISFFVFVILPGSNTGNIFVDFWGRGITMKICWENPNLFKTEQTNFGQLTREYFRGFFFWGGGNSYENPLGKYKFV